MVVYLRAMIRFTEQWLAARKARGGTKADAADAKPTGRPGADAASRPADVVIVFPWPPSGNHGTKHPGAGVHYLTEEHKAYREEVARIAQAHGSPHVRSPYGVYVLWGLPDRRRRDSDNCQKVLFDAMKAAGVIADDSMLDRVTYMERIMPHGGCVRVVLWEES